MSEISREDLRQHCIRTIEHSERMVDSFGGKLELDSRYVEHKMVLELIEKAEKLDKIEQFIKEYDGAIIISDNMGIVSDQKLIDELKQIVGE